MKNEYKIWVHRDHRGSIAGEYEKKAQGLGLTLVYNIFTRIHNGHVEIESEEGKGTTIHIYLPKTQPEKQMEAKEVVKIMSGD